MDRLAMIRLRPRDGFSVTEAAVALLLIGSVSIAALRAINAASAGVIAAERTLAESAVLESLLDSVQFMDLDELNELSRLSEVSRVLEAPGYSWALGMRHDTLQSGLFIATVSLHQIDGGFVRTGQVLFAPATREHQQ